LAAVYEGLGELARAEEQWRLVVAEAPAYQAGCRGLGEVLLRQGKHDDSQAEAGRMEGDPLLRWEGLFLRARVAAARGDPGAGRRALERAVREHPGELEPLRHLCQYLFEYIDVRQAEGPLEELARRAPDDASAHHNLGIVYLRTGRPRQAVGAFQESLRLRPDAPVTLLQLGHALREDGRPGEAVAAWEQALRLDPGCRDAAAALEEAGRRSGEGR
jgi:tetratricopeptide (TPR) repeat protein